MFNGIVETIGTIHHTEESCDCLKIMITPDEMFDDLSIGDSVSVNGVCLTVTHLTNATFAATVVPETLRLTNLGALTVGSQVNLERSLKADGRISGHYVQGHIDGMGEIIDLQPDGEEALLAKISLPAKLAKYVVNKGYIALDGMSITVIDSTVDVFTVTFIPHTQKITIVNQYRQGAKINIEVDILGKFVEKLLAAR